MLCDLFNIFGEFQILWREDNEAPSNSSSHQHHQLLKISVSRCVNKILASFLIVLDMKTVNTVGAEEPSVTAMSAAVAEWLVFVIINKN